MSDSCEILFQLVVKKEGNKYRASTLSGSYSVTSSSPIDAVMSWGFQVREGIKRYRNGEITLQLVAGFALWMNLSGSLYVLGFPSTQAKVTPVFLAGRELE